ncbi:Programmed cell death toxin MazF [Candidatus Syntrophocurvum alkaliphilum]|uniref:Programmed cell death toxin MazF n=1 Tax=Candidatus Syntrophocurvum alkaliphilum TaxID=2293317 RepID=A0A6I6DED5_9FIRM|nr:type II toxin-antitoxin system PemK/MazF family toxin [Candidatus Syntrophocurvum alkaliphilum]QGU00466.1 Programmed cell death toxin MazF [Candidatus Syntrophocurvum alkaliphilum]
MGYIPEQGDIILIEFDPQTGHEQKGKRPAFVVSNKVFNQFTKLAIVCPITNTNRGFPLHVPLDDRNKTTGVIMCEQGKALDIVARNAIFIEKAPDDILEEVVDIYIGFVEITKS